jgi:carbamoyltransferase
MQSTAPVLEDFRSALRGGLHADGSTRPQVCGPRDNALFHRLLTAVGDINGVPAVINTSFNERGLPMVSSPLEALLSFVRSDADMLVVGDLVVRREPALS